MIGTQRRMVLGAGAAIVSLLIFHQGMWALLHVIGLPGLTMPAPFPTDPTPPFGVPVIFSMCFWAGLWGALFAAIWHGPKSSYWFGGVWLGVVSVLVSFFIVFPLKGLPFGGGDFATWLRALLMNGSWGLGMGGLLTGLLGEDDPEAEGQIRFPLR